MIDDLIEYYQRELSFLRDHAGAFADAHPKIAARLRLTRDAVEDPHIGRLIEAVAFMNARLRHKLDDEFPELSDALLLTLYPHLVQPVPSSFIARLEPDPELAKPMMVAAGTALLTESLNGEPCRYRLAQPVKLLPLRLAAAQLTGLPFEAPPLGMAQAKGVLRLTFTTTRPDLPVSELGLDQLRLFIKSDPRRAQLLIEQLGAHLIGVGVASGTADARPVLLPATALRLCGMGADELLLPQDAVASHAHAALQEHFAYPQKHLFFELQGLTARTLDLAGPTLELFLFLDRVCPELERAVRADDFELFAAPALNLFEFDAEPIRLDHGSIEYRMIPDARREDAIEVHSVLAVTLQDGSGQRRVLPPMHGLDHGGDRAGRIFYTLNRRSSFGAGGGDDLFLSLADLEGRLFDDDSCVVMTRILATNRDLPARLPFGGGRPSLKLVDPIPGVAGVSALTKPTPTRRPARRRAAMWKLLGQLSMNHLSMVGGPDGAKALREVLALYDVEDGSDGAYLRERIVGVEAAPGVARVRLKGHSGIAAGTDIVLELDDDRFSGSGLFLLCMVIERFLASTATVNSFTRVSARLRGEGSLWTRWPARIGDRTLV